MRYPFTPIRKAKIWNTDNTNPSVDEWINKLVHANNGILFSTKRR